MCDSSSVPISQVGIMYILISSCLDVVAYTEKLGDLNDLIAVHAVTNQKDGSVSEMRDLLYGRFLQT